MGSLNQLDLLREEHLKLQSKYEQLQQQYAFLQAKVDPGQSPDAGSLAGELFATMKNLFEQHTFRWVSVFFFAVAPFPFLSSDIVIRVDGRDVKCHKFLLMTRSHHWNDLEGLDSVEIKDTSFEAFEVVYRWMYMDVLPRSKFSNELLKEVCQIAFRYHFNGLQARCVQLLKARVDVSNCISLYEFADVENVIDLRDYCGAVVAAHWSEFKPQQFAHLPAPSLFRLLKKNSHHVLHSIIQLNREDVLLLYFIENDSKVSALVNAIDQTGLSPLELALTSGHINMANQLLSKNANCNAIDEAGKSILARMIEKGRTAILLSIVSGNLPLAKVLINNRADIVKADGEGRSPLSIALFERNDLDLSAQIVKLGGISVVNHRIDKESLLHIAVKRDSLEISKFLLENNAVVDVEDKSVSFKLGNILYIPSFASYHLDSYSTLHEHFFSAGAQVDSKDSEGNTLLVQRILQSDDAGATFLLEQGAKHLVKDSHGRSCFELAAFYGLINTLRVICGLGVNINERTGGGFGYTVLKHALSEGHYDCASLLVSLGCDLESVTADGSFIQTMLHHFIDIADEKAAVFLVQNGCNGDATRAFRDSGDEKEEAALHRAVASGLNELVAALVTSKVNLNWQDAQGRTACHIGVQEKNAEALSALLKANDVSFLSIRDKIGQTPFSLAVVTKEHSLAAAIVERQPHVALQTNGNGENLLHTSVKSNDLESVLFLLSTHTDATRVTTDGSKRSALHYAANVDNELILRNLILAGCDVGLTAADGSTALHVAVRANRPVHAEILLENGADPNLIDERRENGRSLCYISTLAVHFAFIVSTYLALLAAVRCGSVDCVKVLVANANVDSLAVNKNAQSALHLCATLTGEKVPPRSSPAEICDLLLRREAGRLSDKEFGAFVDLRDADGNTDSLEREPRWSDGDMCDCGVRFSITVRKHHCSGCFRHCGRLVCAKCSEVTMPIAKFGEEKRVRVCSLCAEVLTTGGVR
ncbi:FYVE zinc finger [Ancylostoma duodenale]|uniref:FYVE zinc finger n=1 Tax=Ancylostoma duodenale TaxID=51022 RepID=A0A0C2GUS4_9BILA|nr:FYVE zinc finger [Ancylostoma duodenale]